MDPCGLINQNTSKSKQSDFIQISNYYCQTKILVDDFMFCFNCYITIIILFNRKRDFFRLHINYFMYSFLTFFYNFHHLTLKKSDFEKFVFLLVLKIFAVAYQDDFQKKTELTDDMWLYETCVTKISQKIWFYFITKALIF